MSAENNANIVDKNTILRGNDFAKFGFMNFGPDIYRRNYGSLIIEIWDWYVEGADNSGNNYCILVKQSCNSFLIINCYLHAITVCIIENLFSLLTLIEENGKLREGGER